MRKRKSLMKGLQSRSVTRKLVRKTGLSRRYYHHSTFLNRNHCCCLSFTVMMRETKSSQRKNLNLEKGVFRLCLLRQKSLVMFNFSNRQLFVSKRIIWQVIPMLRQLEINNCPKNHFQMHKKKASINQLRILSCLIQDHPQKKNGVFKIKIKRFLKWKSLKFLAQKLIWKNIKTL